jgi:hypothetical protein
MLNLNALKPEVPDEFKDVYDIIFPYRGNNVILEGRKGAAFLYSLHLHHIT